MCTHIFQFNLHLSVLINRSENTKKKNVFSLYASLLSHQKPFYSFCVYEFKWIFDKHEIFTVCTFSNYFLCWIKVFLFHSLVFLFLRHACAHSHFCLQAFALPFCLLSHISLFYISLFVVEALIHFEFCVYHSKVSLSQFFALFHFHRSFFFLFFRNWIEKFFIILLKKKWNWIIFVWKKHLQRHKFQ